MGGSDSHNDSGSGFYHDGARELQDQFDSRRLADRLEEGAESVFTDAHREYIERQSFFFLATADAQGAPDCSYKGGVPGFVRVLDESTLAFPDYDGNGMFRSLGNIRVNPQVGLLFINFEQPYRWRINGTATVHDNDPLLEDIPGAQLIVRVRATHIFKNCPRYIHKAERMEISRHAPRRDYEPPDAEWKQKPDRRDVLPRRPPKAD